MTMLLAGLVLFFGAHLFSAFRSRAPGQDLRQKLGYGPYMGLYSLISIAGFVLLIMGYDAMRPAQVLYTPPVWGRHLNYILIPLALIALVTAYLPTGHIKKILKHPMLVAVKLWAFGHLLANGDVASVLLFGSFLAYAVIDRIAVKRRGDIGPRAETVASPLADLGAVVIGLGLAVAIIVWLHPIL
ncbi:MAG: NnrU family protein, partial [Hyphomonadaceae bacterium]|nr:NnrU family protein [Hyphomonadaceae bacterium]